MLLFAIGLMAGLALGMIIVGSMVYFTAKRALVEKRFRELQAFIGTFE